MVTLQSFAPAKKRGELANPVDNWMELYDKFGQGWGRQHARAAVLGMLPQELCDKVIDKDNLTTVHDVVRYLRKQLVWSESETLARSVASG